ncbi:MAG: apolipoprotein N-acyltransferase [Acidobacteriota bacterium]
MAPRVDALSSRTSAWISVSMGALSGALMAASMPPLPTGLVAFVSLVPLLAAVARAHRPVHAALSGLACGSVFFAGCTYWVALVLTNYGRVSMLVAVLVTMLFVLYLALFPMIFAWAVRRVKDRWAAIWLGLAPFVWVGTEHLRTWLFTGFPWCLLGYSQASLLPVAQVASLGGVYAVSLLAAMVSAGLFALYNRQVGLGACAIAGVALFAAWGRLQLSSYPAAGSSLRIGVVQPCAPPVLASLEETAASMDRHVRLTREIPSADLIVWPENSLVRDVSQFRFFRENIRAAASGARAPILVNSIEEVGPDVYNSSVLVSPANEEYPRYDKMHLVPFGEYVPLKSVLRFAGKVLQEVSDFSPGQRRVLFEVAGARFACAICYEIIYPGEVAAFVRDGAVFLVTQSNDSWYGNTVMPPQHNAMAAFRAIENRRYLVRATNSGISSVVDPAGRVVTSTRLGDATAFAAEVRPSREFSPYTRSHDAFAWACLALSLAALAATFLRL